MKFALTPLFISIAILFTSCTANYVSQQIPTPILTGKGQLSTMLSYTTERKLNFEGAYSITDKSAIIATFESRGKGLSHDVSRGSVAYGRFSNDEDITTMLSEGVSAGSTRTGPQESISYPWIANDVGRLSGTSDFVQAHVQISRAHHIPFSPSEAEAGGAEVVLGFAGRVEYLFRYKFDQTETLWSGHYDSQSQPVFDTTSTSNSSPKHTLALTGALFASIGTSAISFYSQLLFSLPLLGFKDYWLIGWPVSAGLRVRL